MVYRAQADPPDLIISDYELPGLNGLDLLKSVRQDKALHEMPFILIAPEIEQQFVARAAEYRVNAFVLKPFSYQTLIDKVNLILERLLNPSEVDVFYREANQLAQTNNLDDALERYQEALKSAKHQVAAIHYKIGRVHEQLDKDREAEENYHEAIAKNRLFVDAMDALGTLNLRQGQAVQARELFEKSSQISPLNADRQLKLGEALLENGEFEAAERAFKLSLNLDPSQTHIFNQLGITLRRQGKLAEAGEFFKRAIEVTADDENLYYNLSRVYLDQGYKEMAVSYLEKALAIKPGFQEAEDLIAQIRST
jgi:tetratricopeptide (TPR) repeat protein